MSRLAVIAERDARTWRRAAACRGKDPRIFFERDLEPVARRICSACPVRDACLDEAIAEDRDGYWGGASRRQRDRVAERRRQAATRPKRRPPKPAGHHYQLLLQLVEHPGRWARIDRYPSHNSAAALASLLRNRQRPTPPGRWQFEGRINPGGGSDLYARYDGPASDDRHHAGAAS